MNEAASRAAEPGSVPVEGTAAMSVLLVTPFYTPQTGGVTSYVEDLRRSLLRRGHRVQVLRFGSRHRISPCMAARQPGVSEFYLRSFWCPEAPLRGLIAFLVFFLPTLWQLARFIRQHEIQIVCLEYPQAYMLYFVLLRRWTGIRLIAGLHGDDVRSLHLQPRSEQAVVRWIVRSADCVLAHSKSLMGDAEAIIRRLPDRRTYLPYWVDLDTLRRQAQQPIRQVQSYARKYVLTVAKLYSRKGIDVLLDALCKLQHLRGDYRFVVAGDGPEEAALRQKADERGLQDFIHLMGYVDKEEIPALIHGCELFVLPSLSEPFGIALLEAMVFGKPIVASRVGGIPEFVQDGYNGLLVEPGNADELAAAIERMLEDKGLHEQTGRNGAAAVREHYDTPAAIVRYERLFQSVLGRTAEGVA